MANERSGEVIPPPMHTDDSISTASNMENPFTVKQKKTMLSSWTYMGLHVYV